MGEIFVTIDKLSYGGAGFGRVNGKACFVPGTAPGDVARIRVRSEKRSYIEGELVDLVESSRYRVKPPCPVFGLCGGCNWQHFEYAAQLSEKDEIFADLLWRSARVGREHIQPILPAPNPYGYRSRIQLKTVCIAGTIHMGFYKPKSHSVVDIPDSCAIAHPDVNRVVREIRQALKYCPEPDKVSQIDVATGDDGKSITIWHYNGTSLPLITEFLNKNKHTFASIDGVFVQSGRKSSLTKIYGIDNLSYRIPQNFLQENPLIELIFSKGGFSQVNYMQNLQLLGLVWSWAELTGRERILDLYCGNGNFSIPLTGFAHEVLGLEEFGPSINDAFINCKHNCVSNAEYYCKDAVAEVNRLVAAGEKFDIVLLDPPRTGASEVVGHLNRLEPRAIIYVSCDPATLARDIGILQEHHYQVVKSRPVDMFPQTYHMESITLLKPI